MCIRVRVVPRAKEDKIEGFSPDRILRVRVAAPLEKNRANERLVRVLANALEVARSQVRIVVGRTAREKVVEVKGADPGALERLG
ncbi:MAG TPA: DUF167 domain-containing protein [Candidatus Latescibacteria bacterium]|nr:DUF167 domain-containing protein [Candidatus Latescibacterota bacterium]